MKKKFLSGIALACAAACAVFAVACAPSDRSGGSKQLAKPVEFEDGEPENLAAFERKADAFASEFAAAAYANSSKTENFTVSPVSVYSALALAAECSAGETRREILTALGVTYEQLRANYSALYSLLNVTNVRENTTTDMLTLSNSLWLDERLVPKQTCVGALSECYHSQFYTADFLNDNENANRAVRDLVKEQTKELIDKDFQLSSDTLFTLINTLYLKTVWTTDGEDLPYTEREYGFGNADGSTAPKKLLMGRYYEGRVYEGQKYVSFYTEASGGYKVKFILPKDGYSLADVFTAKNIAEANAVIDYLRYDEDGKTEYLTRCVFPEFRCGYDEDVIDILRNRFGVTALFDEGFCDFSAMTDDPSYCSKVQHVTDLTVDKTGIEGAAVTVTEICTSGAPAEKTVYADFVLDRAFGFVITNKNNVALFTGAVNRL